MRTTVNINADLGEGAENDAQIMSLIASCNIACDGHAGDLTSMKKTIVLAQKHQVKIGVHPSYPDRENFGRKSIQISSEALQKSLEQQLINFKTIADNQNAKIHHVKPHGALYNDAAKDEKISNVIVSAIFEVLGKTTIYVPPQSTLSRVAKEAGLIVCPEAFIDRKYQEDGSLVSRKEKGALITDKLQAWNQLNNLIESQQVETRSEKMISMEASTFCIHGDQENTVEILEFIHRKSKEKNWSIA